MAQIDHLFAGANSPGLHVWRIEQMRPVQVPDDSIGQFYEGDAYVLVHTSDVKGSRKSDIHIWLGSGCSADECGSAAIFMVQIDEGIFAGHATQSRVVQGAETGALAALFKPYGGITINAGGATSGFRHVDAELYQPSLLHVKGKRHVVTRPVPLAAPSLNEGDCFILDMGLTLYLWTGQKANVNEKAKAVEVMSRLHASRGGKPHRVLYQEASAEEQADFWSVLGGSSSDVQPAIPDEDATGTTKTQAPRLFHVADGAAMKEIVPSGRNGKLARAQLPSGDVALLDNDTEIFVWVSKTASASEKKNGMALASSYVQQHGRPASTLITVVREGGESALFKAIFDQWDPISTLNVAQRGHSSVAQSSDKVDLSAFVKASVRASDLFPTGGELHQMRVQGTSVKECTEDEQGSFCAGDSYVILYYYKDGSQNTRAAIFFWLGRHSSDVERGAAALTAKDYTEDLAGQGIHATQIKVTQGSEPACLSNLFSGLMTIHSGGSQGSLEHAPPHLYHVRGMSSQDTKAVETAASARSLNSSDCFVVVADTTVFNWCGQHCTEAERTTAATLAQRLAALRASHTGEPLAVQQIAEGEEPEDFWKALGGKAEYPVLVPPPSAPEPRMFVLSDISGSLRVEEVHHWSQDDLIEDDVILMDAGHTIYVWVGSRSSAREQAEAVTVGQKFLDAAVASGTHDASVPLIRLNSGGEPPMFTALFPGWEAGKQEVKEDPYEQRVKQLKAQKEAEKERQQAQAEQAVAARRAAVLAAEAKRAVRA